MFRQMADLGVTFSTAYILGFPRDLWSLLNAMACSTPQHQWKILSTRNTNDEAKEADSWARYMRERPATPLAAIRLFHTIQAIFQHDMSRFVWAHFVIPVGEHHADIVVGLSNVFSCLHEASES